MSFFAEIDAAVADHGGDAACKPFADCLAGLKAQLQEATFWLMQNGLADPDNAGAASTDYLHLFGVTALAYMWLKIAHAAQTKIAGGDADPWYAHKLATGRYFVDRIAPDGAAHLAKLKTGAGSMMALPAEAF